MKHFPPYTFLPSCALPPLKTISGRRVQHGPIPPGTCGTARRHLPRTLRMRGRIRVLSTRTELAVPAEERDKRNTVDFPDDQADQTLWNSGFPLPSFPPTTAQPSSLGGLGMLAGHNARGTVLNIIPPCIYRALSHLSFVSLSQYLPEPLFLTPSNVKTSNRTSRLFLVYNSIPRRVLSKLLVFTLLLF